MSIRLKKAPKKMIFLFLALTVFSFLNVPRGVGVRVCCGGPPF